MTDVRRDSTQQWDELAASGESQRYSLQLFVSGMTPRSVEAITRLKEILEAYLPNRYDLEIVDIYQQPRLAKLEQVIATPTLVKKLPLPLKRLVGDLSQTHRVLHGLGLSEKRNA